MEKLRLKFIYNRRNVLNKEGNCVIELRITQNRKSIYISTGIFVSPNQWNDKKSEINANFKNYQQVNSYLSHIKNSVENFEISQISKNKKFKLSDVKQFVENTEEKNEKSFIDFCYTEIEANNSITLTSKRKHKVSIRALQEIAPNCTFDDLTYELIQKFDYHVRAKETVISENTVQTYHKNIKRYIILAIKKDLIVKNPYNLIRLKKVPTSRTSIEVYELELIEKLVPDYNLRKMVEDIDEIKDFFLFACYTGLRYSDLKQLHNRNFTQSEKGLVLELEHQQKTEKPLYLPLSILFNGKPEKIIKPYLSREGFIVRRDAKYLNKALKYIALSCGIKKNLTLHVARHTFGTMLASITGDPFIIQDLMSHSDIKTSMNYIHLSRDRKDETLKKVDWGK
jgi:integrase